MKNSLEKEDQGKGILLNESTPSDKEADDNYKESLLYQQQSQKNKDLGKGFSKEHNLSLPLEPSLKSNFSQVGSGQKGQARCMRNYPGGYFLGLYKQY